MDSDCSPHLTAAAAGRATPLSAPVAEALPIRPGRAGPGPCETVTLGDTREGSGSRSGRSLARGWSGRSRSLAGEWLGRGTVKPGTG